MLPLVNPKPVISVWVMPSKDTTCGETYFAAALELLKTPRTLTENTFLKSSLVRSSAGFTTVTPAFCGNTTLVSMK